MRAQPLSVAPVASPEALVSWISLASEDVAGLIQASGGGATDEQKKVIAAGLQSTLASVQDLSSLARNRGFETVTLTLDVLVSRCRMALGRL